MARVPGLSGLEQVGRGGFGTVYRARDDRFDRDVAVKVLHDSSLGEAALARFDRECRATGLLSDHPNIVAVHDSGQTPDGSLYLVMELLSGGSLAERIAAGPLPPAEVVSIGVALSGALETAHRAGVVHRDVKPENVLFSAFGTPKLVDFGIARMKSAYETRSGSVSATLSHAPPEAVAGAEVTEAADVYSLASVLHAALSGRAPFDRPGEESLVPLIARIATEPPPDLRAAGVPDALATVVERGLAKDPAERPPTAAEMGEALREAGRAMGMAVAEVPLAQVRHADDLPVSPAEAAAAADSEAAPTPQGTMDVARARQVLPEPDDGPTRARRFPRLAWWGAATVAALALVVALLAWPDGSDGDVGAAGGGTTTVPAPDDVDLVVTDEVTDVDGLEVARSYAIGEDRTIGSDVTLANAGEEAMTRIWFEVVPKELAARVADVAFTPRYDGVVVDDPIVYWLVELQPGAQRTLSWSTPLPTSGEATAEYLQRAVSLHRIAVEDDANRRLIAEAVTALESDTGAEAVDPGETVGPSVDPGAGAGGTGGVDPGSGPGSGGSGRSDGGGGHGSGGGSGSGPTAPVTPGPSTTSTTRPPPPPTTAPRPTRPGAPRNVVVRAVGGDNGSVTVEVSWQAPGSGGQPTGYRIRRQERWLPNACGGSPAAAGWVDAGSVGGSSHSARLSTSSTQRQCSWVTWEVAAVNSAGSGPYTTAVGIVPDVAHPWPYHLVRAVGGMAMGLADRDCGRAPSWGCASQPGAGTRVSPGTGVAISLQG